MGNGKKWDFMGSQCIRVINSGLPQLALPFFPEGGILLAYEPKMGYSGAWLSKKSPKTGFFLSKAVFLVRIP